jgi:hypothetical protein
MDEAVGGVPLQSSGRKFREYFGFNIPKLVEFDNRNSSSPAMEYEKLLKN